MRAQHSVLLVSLLSLINFLLVALLKSSFTAVYASINSWAASIQAGSLTVVAEIISIVFDTNALLALSLLTATVLFYKNYRKNSALLLAATGGGALMVEIAKTLIHSARPSNGLILATGYSFPSGHVTGSIVFFGLLTYFVWQIWNSAKAKIGSSVLYIAITFVVSLDRIYLNVHWFRDVLGGCLLGTFWLTFSMLTFQYLEATKKFPGFLAQREKNN